MSAQFAYRAICSHGKVQMITHDAPDMLNENAKELAKCIKAGLAIDRVTIEEARKSDMFCELCRQARKEKRSRK